MKGLKVQKEKKSSYFYSHLTKKWSSIINSVYNNKL